ncbi:MAG: dihydropteroate synthase [Alphaproteobacteria bacterium]|uniref:Dihydropteroate synthase n=1 Tax=Candidatus Nitrobium versatile TaxID=2884831 RepID=A0A953M2N9_9BACT|nr:dihydropteroate synthase [Candidatus Nitrobium versatile]
MKLEWSHFRLNFSKKSYIMGVLNVTPDSFSDGGLFFDKGRAVEHAFRMVEDGADILDIGGESTRPGSDPVSLEEELRRTLPVIEAIAEAVKVPVSIDTYKAEVARRALDAGASLVNDISGLRFDPGMPKLVAERRVPVVLMHIKGNPKDMQKNPEYEALIPEVMEYLRISILLALKSGIPENMILIDPGIGFGKTASHNLEIIRNLQEFTRLGKPLVMGVSRKAFLGKILDDAPATDRLEGTAAAVAVSLLNGAHIVRVHDVKEMARVAKVVDAIKRGSV